MNAINPDHYSWSAVQGIESLRAISQFDYQTGTALKYVIRYPYKALPWEDLSKAKYILEKAKQYGHRTKYKMYNPLLGRIWLEGMLGKPHLTELQHLVFLGLLEGREDMLGVISTYMDRPLEAMGPEHLKGFSGEVSGSPAKVLRLDNSPGQVSHPIFRT